MTLRSRVVELRRAGAPHKVIAQQLGITVAASKNHAHRAAPNANAAKRARIAAELRPDRSNAEIARTLGVSIPTVRRVRRDMEAAA